MTEDQFPAHKCGLFLTHNEHRDYYETIEKWLDGQGQHVTDDEWVSDEQRKKAIETDNCWVLQWYPDTPVGFNKLAACDLDVLLAAAKDGQP